MALKLVCAHIRSGSSVHQPLSSSATMLRRYVSTQSPEEVERMPERRRKIESTFPFHNDIALSANDISTYRKQGFVTLNRIFSDDFIEVWRGAVHRAVSKRTSRIHHGEADATNVDLEYLDAVFTQRVNLFLTDSEMCDIFNKVKYAIGKYACLLEGIDAVRLYHDQALIKEPWSNPTSWHMDMPYWSFTSKNAISAWIPLDEATVPNGCMHMIPGSHRVVEAVADATGTFAEVKIGKGMSDVFGTFPAVGKMDALAIPLPTGSISFHNGMTIHGAGANMTSRRRTAMTFQMMPSGALFNGKQNILSKKQLAEMKIGQVLNDESMFPLMYR